MASDEQLYARVKQGDMRAFDELYARYESRLFGFLMSQTGSRADAEDLFHESFLSALKAREVTFESGSFSSWLYRIARNKILNRRRSEARGGKALTRLPERDAPPRADDGMATREMFEALDGAVARLPDSLSEIYHLRSSGLSYEEIASVLEIPLGTLKSRMHQMVSTLREELKAWTVR
jgi:RNA polymerase sigma-70 factor (ECF subfamily)